MSQRLRRRLIVLCLSAALSAATTARAEVNEQELNKRRAEAGAHWEEIVDDLDTVDDFDPAKAADYQMKLIRISDQRNLVGKSFGTEGGYDFATEIDGKPFAGRYAPEVRAAIHDALTATGIDALPDEPYDVVAAYDGTRGKLMRHGGAPAADARAAEEVIDVPVLKIVGLHCGPVAVFSQFSAEGSVGPTVAGIGWGARLVNLLIMTLAGFAVLLKAGFAPLAALPALRPVRDNLTSRNQIIIGAALLVPALIYLIRGYVYYGLLGNLALAAAGVYLMLDRLELQSWWKPEFSAKLRLAAVPIGMACIAIGIWRLLLGFPAIV